MKPNPFPTRPASLQEGKEYLLRQRAAPCQEPAWERVTFVGYSPCAAFVFVEDRMHGRMRIPREELFI